MDDLGTGRQLGSAARSVLAALNAASSAGRSRCSTRCWAGSPPSRARFRLEAAEPPLHLPLRAVDVALVALTVAPAGGAVLTEWRAVYGATQGLRSRGDTAGLPNAPLRYGVTILRQKLVSLAAPILFSPIWMWSRWAIVGSTRRRRLPRLE